MNLGQTLYCKAVCRVIKLQVALYKYQNNRDSFTFVQRILFPFKIRPHFNLIIKQIYKQGARFRWKIAQVLEIRWWKRYLKNQDKNTYLEQKKQYWTRTLEWVQASLEPNQMVLDAGCGPAGMFILLDKQQVTAVDPLLNQYQEQLPHFKYLDYPNVQFFSESLEAWQSDKQFDWIFCLNAINHVQDIQVCLDKIMDSLKPDGTLILGIDAHRFSWMKYIFQWIPGDVLHPHQYTRKDYKMFLNDRGGQIILEYEAKPGWIFNYILIKAIKRK